MLKDKRILLIIGGGIAAYKSLDLARRLMDQGASVRGVLTKAGSEFITPLSVASLTGDQCFTDLFDLKDEAEMGHIRLSREADLVLVAPATADLMAKMAAGLANDLASTLLLATDKPVMVAPAMNAEMWAHKATQRNLATLKADGIKMIEPGSGMLACGEVGPGRLAEVPDIVAAVGRFLDSGGAAAKPLAGKRALVTAGPTHEPIDPVRYIANRSSGKQGYAVAASLAALGADVTLVSGPTALESPKGVTRQDVETALQMEAAVTDALPADIVVCVAAVADWRMAKEGSQKLKKTKDGIPALDMVENPDILRGLSHMTEGRPELVVGFAAETESVIEHASAKRARKGCDWIVANDVSHATGIMGGDQTSVHILSDTDTVSWTNMSKDAVGVRLAGAIADYFSEQDAEA